jgi:hypothetical protein
VEHAPTLTFAAVEVRKQQPGARASPFHGVNTGSNPVGDANFFNNLHATRFSRGTLIRGQVQHCPENYGTWGHEG